MTDTNRALLWLVLLGSGICWGTSQPLTRFIATAGLHPFGVVFWQTLIVAIVLSLVLAARGKRVPLDAAHIRFYAVAGLIGTALPHSLSFFAARQLPAGILAILMSSVPLLTLLVGTAAGTERPGLRRIAGLMLGVLAVVLIVAPGTSLPDPAKAAWAFLSLGAATCYALENTWMQVARPARLDAVGALCGLSWAAILFIAPLQLVPEYRLDLTVFGPPHLALLVQIAFHISAYLGLIWLIGRGGAVFASQVGYVVMGAGVLIGMVALGERHPPTVWAALALMAIGITMVRPRRALAEPVRS